ncbi:hypothetical protein A6A04_13850 [Paramagnetospirillum marisnigri]|uniref:Lipoprotein n=1 Tax=Paramagnetospirillum marisnigri TaxID=1285242 RepID=A0A178MU04_9PROT|nr:hypothetical protein [Paramagnetospirillum marisnigri]OAN53684.1 hypothetical protein A6A04_13850 [Paramagnetospirillum marisnigri]
MIGLRWAGVLGLALALGGCGTCDLGGVQMRDSLTTGRMVFTGPSEQRDGACHADGDGERLRSEVDKATGKAIHWVDARMRWTGTGTGRSSWVSAKDAATGKRLALGLTFRDVGECSRFMGMGCDHREEMTAQIPEDVMRAGAEAEDGLGITFTRNSGFFTTIRFSREQVRAHLDKVDGWRSANPTKSKP